MIHYYRLSDGSYKKDKFPLATKERCFQNFICKCFDKKDMMFLYLDNVKPETDEKMTKLVEGIKNEDITIIRTNAGSSAGSFRAVFEHALVQDDDELIYFCEDDYWYLDGSREGLEEALDRADYVSLYDHVDKYIPASMGGNPFVNNSGCSDFPAFIFLTESRHWRTTDSTTMTFATTVRTLKADQDVWRKFTLGNHPFDMQLFHELMQRGRSLVTPIPSLSTHCEPRWAAPLINWEAEMRRSRLESEDMKR